MRKGLEGSTLSWGLYQNYMLFYLALYPSAYKEHGCMLIFCAFESEYYEMITFICVFSSTSF